MNDKYQLLSAQDLADIIKVTTRAIWSYKEAGAIPAPVHIMGSTR